MSRAPSPSSHQRPVADSDYGIVGSGGHSRVVASVASRLGLDLRAAFDTAIDRIGQRFLDVEIHSEQTIDDALRLHIGIGANSVRRRIATMHPSTRWVTLIDPGAQTAEDIRVGDGSFINMGAVLQTGVVLGRHVIVNTGTIIDHDCTIGDFAHLAPGSVVCGGVTIGADVLIGARAVILPGVAVGEDAVVGAGAVVTRDVSPGATVVGAPARDIDRLAGDHS